MQHLEGLDKAKIFATMEVSREALISESKEWEESLRVKTGKARELVLIARDYLDENYDRGVTVAETASYVF